MADMNVAIEVINSTDAAVCVSVVKWGGIWTETKFAQIFVLTANTKFRLNLIISFRDGTCGHDLPIVPCFYRICLKESITPRVFVLYSSVLCGQRKLV